MKFLHDLAAAPGTDFQPREWQQASGSSWGCTILELVGVVSAAEHHGGALQSKLPTHA